MKIYKTKKIEQLHSFRHCNKKKMSLVQKRKTTITLKLKQVCVTHRQQDYTGIAMEYTRIPSHIAAYLNRK